MAKQKKNRKKTQCLPKKAPKPSQISIQKHGRNQMQQAWAEMALKDKVFFGFAVSWIACLVFGVAVTLFQDAQIRFFILQPWLITVGEWGAWQRRQSA